MSEPIVPPPPGYTYLGRAGQSYGPNILAANSVTIAFAIIVYALRVYVKGFVIRRIHLEDYLVTAALVGAIARLATQILLVDRYQFGQHIWDYTLDNISKWHQISKAALLFYLFAICCAKVAMLLFYIRLFGVNRIFRWLCYGLIFVVVGYCVAFMLVTSLSCSPISAGWGTFLQVQSAKCIDQVPLSIIIGGFNIATDTLIVLLPIPLVLKLHMPFGDMIGVLMVLATGAIVVAVAIVRQVMIVGAGDNLDFTKISAQIDMWLSIELNVGVAGACLPVLGPLRKKISPVFSSFTSLLHSSRRSRSNVSDEEAINGNSETKKSSTDSSGSPPEVVHKPEYNSWVVSSDKTKSSTEDQYEH